MHCLPVSLSAAGGIIVGTRDGDFALGAVDIDGDFIPVPSVDGRGMVEVLIAGVSATCKGVLNWKAGCKQKTNI